MQRHGARRDETGWLTQRPDRFGAAVVHGWAPHSLTFVRILQDFCNYESTAYPAIYPAAVTADT
jgi:hypothetical protein